MAWYRCSAFGRKDGSQGKFQNIVIVDYFGINPPSPEDAIKAMRGQGWEVNYIINIEKHGVVPKPPIPWGGS